MTMFSLRHSALRNGAAAAAVFLCMGPCALAQTPAAGEKLPAASRVQGAVTAAKPPPTLPIPLANVTQTVMDGATSQFVSNQLRLYNVRIDSDETDLDDYLRMTYDFNPVDQSFEPVEIVKYVNIGVYHAPWFAKNVPHDVTMTTPSGSTLEMATTYRLATTPDSVLKMNLKPGHMLSFYITDPSDQFRLSITNPFGELIYDSEAQRNESVVTAAIPILAPGIHKIRMVPLNEPTVSFGLMFLNGNRRDLVAVGDGSHISNSFLANSKDYAKYRLDLVAGQRLTVSDPSNSEIRLSLVDSRNALVDQVRGLSLFQEVTQSGRYFLFIDNAFGRGGSYSGTVDIQ